MLGLASALLVLAGALAAAIRLTTRRAELALAFGTLAAAMVAFPIHALGLAGALGRTSALLGPSAVGAAALLVSASGRGALGAVLRGVARFVRLPASVLRAAARRRSVALAAIVSAALVVVHALWSGWLLPNDGWDGIWYHDTIIGGALDAGGYAPMALPPT
jgi:hypothetical protein